MRRTTPLFQKITSQLRDILRAKVDDGPAEVEVIDWFSRAALEMIAQGGLGHTFDSLSRAGDVIKFKIAIKEFMPTLSKLFIFLPLFLLVSKWPPRVLRFVAACFPLADVKHMMKLVDTTTGFRQDLFEAKKALLAQLGDVELTNQISGGKDIVSVLMRANADAEGESTMEDKEIMAQMMTLLGAATESTSNALARTIQLLAHRPDVQEWLRQELDGAFVATGSELGYDELMQLPYLDAICRETLRLHPPVSFVTRVLPLFCPDLADYVSWITAPASKRHSRSRGLFKGTLRWRIISSCRRAPHSSSTPSARTATRISGALMPTRGSQNDGSRRSPAASPTHMSRASIPTC
ncbi:cytochrome P450 [Artomyces pyxidatus]|uniref:Cytochrome P450 n=1 Tax=Artomyces pyxidatus TaxID=48021 RepID=A0ACB8SHL9_9AGAM|nr:cytochrome P450 [Artomyces pyxidatus]